ncbi:hypothetical protein HK103_002102 [Boothiomyces macroporosus]|uniref:Poly(A)+ RNA export protein n=1 Tax=Boothiomyces macroporosus TaxID=261099 RepID=A0AAD5ULH3_9FUNG|nr:hypothetical protein HK103_002102 [Boothiomyces macroporosus]
MAFSLGNQSTAKDFEISQPPTDTVSCLAFSPQADLLAASSWDNQTRVYEISSNGSSMGKASIQHDAPPLSVCWSTDGTKVFSAGCDKTAKMFDIQSQQTQQVAAHDAPIKSCKYIDGLSNMNNILVTASWDKTLKYWDFRSSTPVHTLQLPERAYTMDVKGALMVVGTAERHIVIYNLNNPSTPFKTIQSPLKWQTRTISCFIDSSGYAIGGIEGRVSIEYVEEKDQSRKFSFKCHRVDKNVFPVNEIIFHPTYGTLGTCGGDGGLRFWDKDERRSIKILPTMQAPVTNMAFNRSAQILAYSVGYDWHKGHEHHKPGAQIFLHPVVDDDVRPKKK